MRVRTMAAACTAAAMLGACSTSTDDQPGEAATSSDALGEPNVPGREVEARPGWTALPEAPLSPRHGAIAAWVADSLVVLGGRDTPACPPNADCVAPVDPALSDGARFDPSTSTWTPIAPAPIGLENAATATVGDTLYVWLVDFRNDQTTTAFLALDVTEDQWTVLPLPEGETGWGQLAAGLDGEVLLVQGSNEQGRRPDLRFDPATETWRALPDDPLGPTFDRDITKVGDRLVLTGIPIRPQPGGADGPARYRAATWTDEDGWVPLPAGDVIGYDPEWLAVGDRLVNPTTGGADGGEVNGYGRTIPHGGVLDPAAGVWSPLPGPPIEERQDGLVQGNLGDDRLVVNSLGWALQVEAGRWFNPGLPHQGLDGGSVEGVATAVGVGQLFAFGGARFGRAGPGELLASAWVWSPPG